MQWVCECMMNSSFYFFWLYALLYTPLHPASHINFSSFSLVTFVFLHFFPSASSSSSISHFRQLYFISLIFFYFLSLPSCAIAQGRQVRYLTSTGLPSLLSLQQLTDIWLITSCNVYCGIAILQHHSISCCVALNYFIHHSQMSKVGVPFQSTASFTYPFHTVHLFLFMIPSKHCLLLFEATKLKPRVKFLILGVI